MFDHPLNKPALFLLLFTMFLGRACPGSAAGSGTLAAIDNATVSAGGIVTLSVIVSNTVTDIAGLDLTLRVTTSSAAPPLLPTFSLGNQAVNWFSVLDSTDPWHFFIANPQGIRGPAELMRLTLQTNRTSLPNTIYRIEAASAILATSTGKETDVTSLILPGRLVVSPLYGDLNRDGSVTVADVTKLLRIYLGIDLPTQSEMFAGDTRPKPGTEGRSFGNNRLQANDLNWVLRCSLGLGSIP